MRFSAGQIYATVPAAEMPVATPSAFGRTVRTCIEHAHGAPCTDMCMETRTRDQQRKGGASLGLLLLHVLEGKPEFFDAQWLGQHTVKTHVQKLFYAFLFGVGSKGNYL